MLLEIEKFVSLRQFIIAGFVENNLVELEARNIMPFIENSETLRFKQSSVSRGTKV